MKARFCIENTTDRPVAAHLEQISVRYWGLIPPAKKIIWDPENVQLDRGIYTLRAFDATSLNYKAPNMKKEKAKAVVGGILLGAGGVGALVSIPLFAVPGGALTIAGGVVIGVAAAAGAAAAAAGGATNVLSLEYKTGVKRGAVIGKDTKYIVKLVESNEKKELVWEKVSQELLIIFECYPLIGLLNLSWRNDNDISSYKIISAESRECRILPGINPTLAL